MKVIVISGTPGTGKTTVSEKLSQNINFKVISLNDEIIKEQLYIEYDSVRETYIIDEEKIIKHVLKLIKKYNREKQKFILIESHFSDIIPEEIIDIAIILRCHPDELKRRLKEKGYDKAKILENIQSEILGNCVNDFIHKSNRISLIEIDTTNLNIEQLAKIIIEIINKKKDINKYTIGNVDWLEDLFQHNRLKEFFD